MARRSSGWAAVKGIAREIDRANKRSKRQRLAYERAEELRIKNEIREYEQIIKEKTKLINTSEKYTEKFNQTLHAANNATTVSVKEKKLYEVRQLFQQLKEFEADNSDIMLQNLSGVEKSIEGIQNELDGLKLQVVEKQSLEVNAIRNTEAAGKLRADIENILIYTLSVDDALNWDSLKDNQAFSFPKPKKPKEPKFPQKPNLVDIPECPDPKNEKYKPHVPAYMHLMKNKKKARKDAADEIYEADFSEWKETSEKIKDDNQNKILRWETEKTALIKAWENDYKRICDEWQKRKEEHDANQSQYNGGLDNLRTEYEAIELKAVEEYNRLVLARSEYPFSFSKDFQIEYNPDAKLFALDYQLPTIDVVPDLKEEKFIKAKGEVKVTTITEKQRKDIYEALLYAMIIRTIHEIFEADTVNAINTVALNGWVTSVSKATGNDETRCIATISVNKEAFLKINLANVDVKECFKSLKGIGSAKLSDLVPVAPVIDLNRQDPRFIESYNVVEHISEGDNLALMSWEDFEHLIRELFEKEFSANGSEVRVTQASRDGGVDAVIHDPDPIRGGTIVIQAKRYTNTVGVSAVRDLYGTVQHEGALKGILITTSNYGSDAYDFAKGKPLTLMNGGNLIHLLERHGRKARINLAEAKQILKSA